jgi:hypothetical protein
MKARYIYLALCAIAVVLPFSQYVPFHLQYGPDAVLFVQQALANYPARFIALDAIVAAVVFVAFAFFEGRRLGMRHWWVPILGIFAVGVCFAFPSFLYMRELYLEKAASGGK